MRFLVASPGLSPDGRRPAIDSAVMREVDALTGSAERRTRPSHAVVWDLGRRPSAKVTALVREAEMLAREHRIDIAFLARPYRFEDFSVLAMDMDSTVITIECIDEIADFCGKKNEVAAITEAAMRGEISDYAQSLRQRVALLAGLSADVLQEVIRFRLKFTPGVRALVERANRHGLHTLLVSGGFTQFTDFVSQKIGFAQARSNRLDIEDGVLTGRLQGEIVDSRIKAETVREACRLRGTTTRRAITFGDGANDLAMMRASGLSIAHRAKPAVASEATHRIVYGGLDNVLDWFE